MALSGNQITRLAVGGGGRAYAAFTAKTAFLDTQVKGGSKRKKFLEREEIRRLERELAKQLKEAFKLEQPVKKIVQEIEEIKEEVKARPEFIKLPKEIATPLEPIKVKPLVKPLIKVEEKPKKAAIEKPKVKKSLPKEEPREEPKEIKLLSPMESLEMKVKLQSEQISALESKLDNILTEDEILTLIISLMELK